MEKNIRRAAMLLTTIFFDWMVIVAMILIAGTVFIQIFFRYVINSPLAWSEELAKFIFPWLTFAGAALTTRTNGHIKIEYFAGKFPLGVQILLNHVTRVVILIFCLLVLFYTIPLAKSQKGMTSTALNIPLNFYTLSIVIGLLGIVIYILDSIIREHKKGIEKGG